MKAIKKFLSVAGTGNPVYITDMTYPTELSNILGSALNNVGRTTYIISGFDAVSGGTFTPGIVWFNGQVYAFDGDSVQGGQYLFAGVRQVDDRTTIDGQQYKAYEEYYLFTGGSTTSPNGTLVDSSAVSATMIARLKTPLIPNKSITTNMIDSLLVDKLDVGGVSYPTAINIGPWPGGGTGAGNAQITGIRIVRTGVNCGFLYFRAEFSTPGDIVFDLSGTPTWFNSTGGSNSAMSIDGSDSIGYCVTNGSYIHVRGNMATGSLNGGGDYAFDIPVAYSPS